MPQGWISKRGPGFCAAWHRVGVRGEGSRPCSSSPRQLFIGAVKFQFQEESCGFMYTYIHIQIHPAASCLRPLIGEGSARFPTLLRACGACTLRSELSPCQTACSPLLNPSGFGWKKARLKRKLGCWANALSRLLTPLELAALGQRVPIAGKGSGDVWHEGAVGKGSLRSLQHPHVLLACLKTHEGLVLGAGPALSPCPLH